jgi:glutathione peroxidase
MYIVNTENLSWKTVGAFLNPWNFVKGVALMFGIGGGGHRQHTIQDPNKFYSLTCQTLGGETYSFHQLRGKVVLITNTASFCLAAPRNFRQLAELDRKYRERGLVVLAFPCNQFYAQEYKNPAKTLQCTRQYDVDFTVMETIEVNGEHTHPVYKYLKDQTGGEDISWNYSSKFLINRDASLVSRYIKVDPSSMENDIVGLLDAR